MDRDALERAAVEGMLRALGDRWSTYYGKSEFTSFQSALEGHYSGVGLWLRGVPGSVAGGGGVEVGSVQPGSPADRAGLLAGDVLLRVAATDVTTADVPTTAGLLRGEEGTTVLVAVRRGSATRTVRLARATFSTDDVVVERLARWHLPGGHHRLHPRRRTGRRAGRWPPKVPSAPVAWCSTCATTRAGCSTRRWRSPRSSSTAARSSPTSDAARSRGPWTRSRAATRPTPLVVLVNPSTASAAEVVAGALQDRNRAVVVGTRTYGKGSVQEPSTLSDGSALELTVGRYLTPSGRALDGVGIEPDVVVPPGAAPEVAERRAIDVLTGLVAALGGTGRG